MPLAVVCPSCKAKLKAPDALIGKTVKCPGCASPVLVKTVGAVAPAPAVTAAAPRPAPKKRRPPEPEILDEEPVEEALDEVEDDFEDEEVEARPKKKKKRQGEERQTPTGDSSDSERSTASFIHFATLINLIFAPFGYLVPLILWVMKRKESAFIDHHGKTWLNFHLSMFVLSFALLLVLGGLAFALGFVKWWLGMIVGGLLALIMISLSVYMLIMFIVAGMKAKKGEWFEYRCLFRLFK
jgi:uncharacterized Tic20 family protein